MADEEEDDGNLYGTIKREIPHEEGKAEDCQQEFINEITDSEGQIPLELIIKGKNGKLTDEEIQKLIDENYHLFEGEPGNSAGGAKADSSVIYYNGKVYDEKKRAQYGIQRSKAPF